MSNTQADQINDGINRFIDLANSIKNEDVDVNIVATALMSASCIYSTFAAGGNQGGLTEAGVDKVTAGYKKELQRIQEVKKANAGQL